MLKRCLFYILFLVVFFPSTAFAQVDNRQNSQDLISQAKALDGQAVTFIGEAIGDLMPRKTGAWLHLQDSYGTISVLAPIEMAKPIQHWGDYKSRGDMVQVSGTFYRSYPQLGGELFIQAQDLEILSLGSPISHDVSDLKVKLIEVLFVLTVLLVVLRLVIKRRAKED